MQNQLEIERDKNYKYSCW